MFRDYNLSDGEVIDILEQYDRLINYYSKINGKIDKNLRNEIITSIYLKLTKNRKK